MTRRNTRLIKSLFVAATLLVSMPLAAPSFAAQSDIDLLESYIGDWKGRGTTTSNGNTETVVCRLGITSGEQAKVNYHGRCTLAGGNLSIAGTMAYISDSNRFEAVMSSNTAFSGIAVGRRRGGGIDFKLKDRNEKTGADFTIDAGIALKGGDIEVKFSVTEASSGNKVVAIVPFKK